MGATKARERKLEACTYSFRFLVVATILACGPGYPSLHRIASWKLATTSPESL